MLIGVDLAKATKRKRFHAVFVLSYYLMEVILCRK